MSFWIAVIALLAIALGLLLLPLLRPSGEDQGDQRRTQNVQIAREKKQQLDSQLAAGEIDQAEFDAAYQDLQTALALELESGETSRQRAHGGWMAVVVALVIPAASVLLYLHFGEYRVIGDPSLLEAEVAQNQAHAAAAPQMTLEEMEEALKQRLRENPEDAEGWFLMGRTKMARQLYDQAVAAFQRSNDLMNDEPGILFALADALAMQNGGNLLGEPEELVQRGLEIAPRFPNGLWLAGMAAEQREDYAAAYRYWSDLLPLIGDNAELSREIQSMLAQLEERDPSLASAKPDSGIAAADGARLNLQVDIDPELKSRADPQSLVFVYARAMQGPPMPLAVRKLRLADLPVTLTLGDGDAMMPSMKLSSFEQVAVGARVALGGNPIAQDGDFYTELEGIDSSSSEEIRLVIDRVK